MIDNKLYNIGVLGKPHSLNGYLYINHENFFRNLDLTNRKVYINKKKYVIEDIKSHLKNRFLIKFKNIDAIEKAENLRNHNISITKKEKNDYLIDGLPWPGFYINEYINDNIKFLGYFYSDKYIFCNLFFDDEIVIPYNVHYFSYDKSKLILINNLTN